MNIHMNVGNVNGLFHTEAINRKFNKNTEDGEGKTPVFLRRDIAMISPKGKAMSAVERLMKQKDFIMECKDSLLERMTDEESGYSSPAIMKQIDEYDKQLDSIDKEIAKELAKPVDASDKSEENNLYKKDRSVTKQELDNKKMAELTEMSTGLSKSEQMDSVKNRLEGEKHVLEAELKINDSESKRQRIAEIDERTAELTKETFAGIGEIINKPEKDRIELSKEGLDYFSRPDRKWNEG